MSSIWTRQFWKATAERAVKTFGQVAAAAYGADVVNVVATDWRGVLGVAAGATVLSVFTSLASSKVGAAGPSLTGAETLVEGYWGGNLVKLDPDTPSEKTIQLDPELTAGDGDKPAVKRADGYWGGN